MVGGRRRHLRLLDEAVPGLARRQPAHDPDRVGRRRRLTPRLLETRPSRGSRTSCSRVGTARRAPRRRARARAAPSRRRAAIRRVAQRGIAARTRVVLVVRTLRRGRVGPVGREAMARSSGSSASGPAGRVRPAARPGGRPRRSSRPRSSTTLARRTRRQQHERVGILAASSRQNDGGPVDGRAEAGTTRRQSTGRPRPPPASAECTRAPEHFEHVVAGPPRSCSSATFSEFVRSGRARTDDAQRHEPTPVAVPSPDDTGRSLEPRPVAPRRPLVAVGHCGGGRRPPTGASRRVPTALRAGRCGSSDHAARRENRKVTRRKTNRPPVSASHCTARFLLSAPAVKPCTVDDHEHRDAQEVDASATACGAGASSPTT